MASKPAPLVLVDGSSYVYRAFHALPMLTTSDGRNTGAVRGVISMLRKMVAEYPDSPVAVVFDAKGKTFRDDLYAEYKANRPPMPDELREQIEPIHEIVKAMGLPFICEPGVEADDVIGTLAEQAEKAGREVVISTGDKDMAQLVNDDVTLVNTMTDSVMDRAGVHKKFDVWPEQIIDFLALVGDKSDNIPGVPKVGPKTAAKWLKQYSSVDKLVANAEEITGKVGESLRDNLEQLRLSQQLATIQLDVDLDVDPAALKRTEVDHATMHAFCEQFELRSLARQLGTAQAGHGEATEQPADSREVKGDYETVLTHKALDRWLKKIKAAELTAVDTETTSLDY
ncbi:MAG: DNA polymerase I, partial [Halioglobus sp.]|nr:DNA polymerase I [Halioglobus sp.]